MPFFDYEKIELLQLARKSIEAKLEGTDFNPQTDNKKFLEHRGVFVTLHKNEELRGCIGYIEAITSLWEAVKQNALAAAFDDPRFLPLQNDELKDIKIEISVLTVPEKVKLDHIKIGIDGIVLKYGAEKATYLPQVWKHFKTKEDFLSNLCLKAGLPEDAWKDPKVEIYSYQSEIFSE